MMKKINDLNDALYTMMVYNIKFSIKPLLPNMFIMRLTDCNNKHGSFVEKQILGLYSQQDHENIMFSFIKSGIQHILDSRDAPVKLSPGEQIVSVLGDSNNPVEMTLTQIGIKIGKSYNNASSFVGRHIVKLIAAGRVKKVKNKYCLI